MLPQEIQTLLAIIIVAIISLIIGVIVGNIAGRRSAKAPSNKEITELKSEGYSDIATLWYSPATKHIVTEMNEELFKDFSNLTIDQQKKALRLSELFTDWVHPFITTEATPVIEQQVDSMESVLPEPGETSTTIEDTVPQIVPERPGATKPLPFVENESIKVEIPPIPQVAFTVEEPVKVKPIEFETPNEPFDPLTTEEVSTPPAGIKARTVAGQISDIIAQMVLGTPLNEKGIKLIERSDHGVDVWVGMEKFDGVDSIPYPEVRQLIHEAAIRWEQENSTSK